MDKYQVEIEQFKPTEGKHYCIIEAGKSCILRKQISDHLQKKKPYLKEVHNVEDCDVILVFCPIVSRTRTDIDAAVNKLNETSAIKPAIFMVLHLTFDPDKTVPDSSECINRRSTFTVDCLFSEEEGLLTCDKNTKALTKIADCFNYQESCPDILWRCISGLCCYCCQLYGIKKDDERRSLVSED